MTVLYYLAQLSLLLLVAVSVIMHGSLPLVLLFVCSSSSSRNISSSSSSKYKDEQPRDNTAGLLHLRCHNSSDTCMHARILLMHCQSSYKLLCFVSEHAIQP
jgi:hypothetical protein